MSALGKSARCSGRRARRAGVDQRREAHLEHFPSVEAIADAKAEILEGAGADDVLVANAGDARWRACASPAAR